MTRLPALVALAALMAATNAAAQVPALPTASTAGGPIQAAPSVSLGYYPTNVINRKVTLTAITATTSTLVCPATPKVTAQSLQVSVAGGVGVNGEALSSATYGTAAGSPSAVIAAANGQYIAMTPPTNAWTFYSTSAGFAICIQETRP